VKMSSVLTCASLVFVCAAPAAAQDPLIPLKQLLSPASIQAPEISPDGKLLSAIAPLDGAPNLFVGPAGNWAAAGPVTRVPGRGIQAFDVSGNVIYRWTPDSRHLLYLQDNNGDENWNLYVADVESGESKNLTPFKGAQVRIMATSWEHPDLVLVGINNRVRKWHDIYRVNILSGQMDLVEKNDRFVWYLVDNDLKLRLAFVSAKGGGLDFFKSNGDGNWTPYLSVSQADMSGMKSLGFDPTNRILYSYDGRNRNTAALVAMDLQTGETRVLGESPKTDVAGVLIQPVSHKVQAYAINYTRLEWRVLDKSVERDFKVLSKTADGDLKFDGRSRDDRLWLVHYTLSDAPETYYLYDRSSHKSQKLFTGTPQLEGLPLSKLYPFIVKSRDGLDLVSYISIPRWEDTHGTGHPTKPLPMVMIVHGGPSDERPEYGFAPLLQWLTNRGYAVWIANFRGSPGFGKAFLNAQNLEWGGKMNDDLIDQVNWAVDKGFARKDKIALFGGSYGGYATLVGMTMTPDVFACGIDVVGPANLETFMKTVPPFWSIDDLAKRVGDPRTEQGRALLRARSPINFVGQVTKPILIAQGAHDSRVPQAESDRMVEALEKHHVQVTYLLFPDEGHGFGRPANSMAFNAITEVFLARYLGGRSQPIGDALAGSSITVPAGAEHIPGLQDALKQARLDQQKR
jgi:dipeptidyl aminopeptidase/acylaminoacyl peptidase